MCRSIMEGAVLVQAAEPWEPDGWFVGFYDFNRGLEPVGDLVPGVGDVLAWARRNGARDGTPFFVGPSGRADAVVNAFWRSPMVRGLGKETKRRYAFSLKVWLDFLHATGTSWQRATPELLGTFKEWRLSAGDNPVHVVPGSFRVDLAAIRKFYMWAADRVGVENPVRLRVIGETFFGGELTRLEATPSGIRRADVKWLTPEAFRLRRNLGLRGFTAEGLPAPTWRGRTEDRDVAFAEGLYGTGLRVGEWSSMLTVELPAVAGQGLLRCQLASACAKRFVGRRYWMRRRVAQLARYYMEEGSRPAAVARAQRVGRYEQVTGKWLLRRVRPTGVLCVVDEDGSLADLELLHRTSDAGTLPRRQSEECLTVVAAEQEDEAVQVIIGLPAGFLQAGVPGVVATLWPVNDRSTAVLVAEFYRLLLAERQDPATALARARGFLRDVTARELADWFERRYGDSGGTDRAAYEAATDFRARPDPADRPYAHPVYWAGFVYTGP